MANCQNQNQCQREMYFIKEEKPSCCSVTKIPCGQTSQNVVTVLPSCGRNTTCCSVPPVGPPPPMIKTEPCGKVSSSCCAIEKCCTPVYSCLSVVKDPKAAQPTKKCITTPCPPSYCTVNRCQPVCCPTKPYPCVKPKCPVENFCTNVDCENVGLTPYAKEYMSETGKLVSFLPFILIGYKVATGPGTGNIAPTFPPAYSQFLRVPSSLFFVYRHYKQ